jgi:hypothetical protein
MQEKDLESNSAGVLAGSWQCTTEDEEGELHCSCVNSPVIQY